MDKNNLKKEQDNTYTVGNWSLEHLSLFMTSTVLIKLSHN